MFIVIKTLSYAQAYKTFIFTINSNCKLYFKSRISRISQCDLVYCVHNHQFVINVLFVKKKNLLLNSCISFISKPPPTTIDYNNDTISDYSQILSICNVHFFTVVIIIDIVIVMI